MIDYTNTKIIATLGPATNTKEKILELIKAGADVLRLNFSHVDYEIYEKIINSIMEINEESDLTIGILADLQGPKIRIGEVENEGFFIEKGNVIKLSSKKGISDSKTLFISYDGLENDVRPGEKVYIDDGKIILEITDVQFNGIIAANIIEGGYIKARKGVNFPDTEMKLPSLTQKDIEDLNFILRFPINWIALSFVRNEKNLIK